MADGSGHHGRGNLPSADDTGGSLLPTYGQWVAVYRRTHQSVRYRNAVFGGLTLAGALVFSWFVAAVVVESESVSLLSTLAAFGGGALFTFGVGYFVVRYDASCRQCDTVFSKDLSGKRLARRQSDGRTRTVQTLECKNCGHRTSYTCAMNDQGSHRW